jgi:hypothetical protein
MKLKKIIVYVLAVTVLLVSVPVVNVSANPSDTITIAPYWVNAISISAAINPSGNQADCEVKINALSGSTIEADICLYKVNSSGSLTLKKSWLDQTSGSYFNFDEDYTVESGSTYRLTVYAQVTRNGTTETISKTNTVQIS